MAERYIQRFRLTPRQYTAAAPVVLAAGALLEDTQIPRLVAQLKFKSISPELLTALRVRVECLDETGAVQNTVEFCYSGLQVRRGNTFGAYTAIPFPLSDSTRCTVSLLSAAFSGGRTWEAPQGAKAVLLPAFTPLEEAVTDPAQRAQAQGRISQCRYAYREVEDLWYCPCGGVNRSSETSCHRCGGSRSLAARYADPARLEAEARQVREEEAKQAQLREAARLEAEQKKAAQQAAKAEKARQRAERRRPMERRDAGRSCCPLCWSYWFWAARQGCFCPGSLGAVPRPLPGTPSAVFSPTLGTPTRTSTSPHPPTRLRSPLTCKRTNVRGQRN